ncbi:MAG: glutamyl-tRNA reductase, partial [Catenulispora sp.]|nr:glutamyl-tRNA reductase [Catenulispora sp.]
MNVLVAGLSHRTAPIELLERVAVAGDRLDTLLDRVRAGDGVHEAVVVSTCNRTEVYAVVDRFHAGVTTITG